MRWASFETRVPGKWVLTGEHAVLRGATAIALPHPEYGLKFHFQPDDSGKLEITPPESAAIVRELLQSLSDRWEGEDRAFPRPSGQLTLESSIPVGAGLGSSASLCVGMTRWLAEPLALSPSDYFEFATALEHRFHGRSSGMDVATALAAEPISFVMGRGGRALGVSRLPRFTFHDTGLRARTSDCVLQVRRMHEDTPARAMQIDDAMSAASRLAMEGLVLFDRAAAAPEERATGDVAGCAADAGGARPALDLLARAMTQAQECFLDWGLVPRAAADLVERLRAQGALAAKTTGAGGGGMVVALWG